MYSPDSNAFQTDHNCFLPDNRVLSLDQSQIKTQNADKNAI